MTTESRTLIQRAKEAFERRDYVAALADFREVIERHPDFADVRHMTGLCLSYLGQAEEALEQFDRALEKNECYIEALLHRAITLNELARYDEAKETMEKAARCEGKAGGRFPASVSARLANAHATVGELYLAANAPDEAAAELRRALDLRPSFHDVRNRLAEALMEAGETDLARRELETILDLNDRFLRARLNLGLVHYRAGRYDLAREHWDECRAREPGNSQVQAYLGLLEKRAHGAAAGGAEDSAPAQADASGSE